MTDVYFHIIYCSGYLVWVQHTICIFNHVIKVNNAQLLSGFCNPFYVRVLFYTALFYLRKCFEIQIIIDRDHSTARGLSVHCFLFHTDQI